MLFCLYSFHRLAGYEQYRDFFLYSAGRLSADTAQVCCQWITYYCRGFESPGQQTYLGTFATHCQVCNNSSRMNLIQVLCCYICIKYEIITLCFCAVRHSGTCVCVCVRTCVITGDEVHVGLWHFEVLNCLIAWQLRTLQSTSFQVAYSKRTCVVERGSKSRILPYRQSWSDNHDSICPDLLIEVRTFSRRLLDDATGWANKCCLTEITEH